jgi:hypothetical protein
VVAFLEEVTFLVEVACLVEVAYLVVITYLEVITFLAVIKCQLEGLPLVVIALRVLFVLLLQPY